MGSPAHNHDGGTASPHHAHAHRLVLRQQLRGFVLVGAVVALVALVALGIAGAPHTAVGEWREVRGYQMLSLHSNGRAVFNGRECSWKSGTGLNIDCNGRRYTLTSDRDRLILSVGDKAIAFARVQVALARGY